MWLLSLLISVILVVSCPVQVEGSSIGGREVDLRSELDRAIPSPDYAEVSSDDSSNSEEEDVRLWIGPERPHTARHKRGKRRRRWRPHLNRVHYNEIGGEREIRENMLRREHFAEQFLGDRGDTDTSRRGVSVRIATANINKGFWDKMHTDTRVWFLANELDFLVVSDAGLCEQDTRTVWSRSECGGMAPTLLAVGHKRVAIVMDLERWQSRWNKNATVYSTTGRSMSILLRLGSRSHLQIIATYCPDTPQRNEEATRKERGWIAGQVERARQMGYMCVVAGDFNAYPDETLDRHSDGVRDQAAQHASNEFREWVEDNALVSTFKHRHSSQRRFTYQNGGTRIALDDIFVSCPHVHQVQSSGIWLFSLNRSDHVGTPFVIIVLDRAQCTRSRLQNVRAIKAFAVRGATADELERFTLLLGEQLTSGSQRLMDPLAAEQHSTEDTLLWLDAAISNLYGCMYQAAKRVWSENSQGRRAIDRAVSIKRTTKCRGQLKVVRKLQAKSDVTLEELLRAIRRVQWPKWVLFPERIPVTSPHWEGAKLLRAWQRSALPQTIIAMNEWLDDGWKRWKRVLRARRGWRQRRRNDGQRIQRNRWMSSGQVGKLLRNTIGTELPPVNIQGGLVGGDPDYDYVETREAVQAAMTDLLDSWVPADQRTSEPRHLSTAAVEDEESLPTFVKEWMLNDIKAGGSHQEVFLTEPNCWANVCFNESMQNWIDTQVNTGVSPGYGGMPQELWIAAPEPIRARERLIMNTILQTGIVPPILNHRQMIFLPKSPQSTGIWDRQGLPPWRPITVQSSLATRLFTAISGYLERTVPNHHMQHGFQRDSNVQDAALATTLLLDRAVQRREELYLLSKDCEKCYDRIPRWVMAYIYRRIGVPAKLYDILMGFLAAGEIDVRSAFGWIPTGKREFGLGQGSVLSIRHIGLYMDLLMEQQDKGSGAVVTGHNQLPGNRTIAATVLVDDIVDVSTTREGIESRVEVSNKFTGKNATGGVFGATKSFLLHYRPGRHVHEDTVYLNDGYGIPRPVTVVSPAEGFKHLGIIQRKEDVQIAPPLPISGYRDNV